MAVVGSVGTPYVVVDDLKGAVCGGTVDNQVYNVTLVLLEHTIERSLQHIGCIISYRDVSNDHCLPFLIYNL